MSMTKIRPAYIGTSIELIDAANYNSFWGTQPWQTSGLWFPRYVALLSSWWKMVYCETLQWPSNAVIFISLYCLRSSSFSCTTKNLSVIFNTLYGSFEWLLSIHINKCTRDRVRHTAKSDFLYTISVKNAQIFIEMSLSTDFSFWQHVRSRYV